MLRSLAHSPDEHFRWVSAQLDATEPLFQDAKLLWISEMNAYAADAQPALRWALEQARMEEGLGLALAMARYWWVLGERSSGRSWLLAFIALPCMSAELSLRARLWLYALRGRDD